jgi:uroporphyrinogen decarboxylase
MTARERWVRTLHFHSVDHVPDEEFGYRDDTPTRWHKEGLPREVDSSDKADRYFDFDRRAGVSGDIGLRPPFEARVIEETEDRRAIMDGPGVSYIQPKDGHSTIPHYLDFPIKTRDEWQRFEERPDPADPGRLPRNLPEMKAQWERRGVRLSAYREHI